MIKSELIEILTKKQPHLLPEVVESAVNCILETMIDAIGEDERIEIRGFGAFYLKYHPARQGRNPKTGQALSLSSKYLLHFKVGKELRDRVNAARLTNPLVK
jgi:integration host factor subunit beta